MSIDLEISNEQILEVAPVVQVVDKPLPADYIEKDKRKKILLLSDDLRLPSGVGAQSREIVLNTCHKYNWVQVGAAVNHPEQGKILDLSQSLSEEAGIPDASLKIYPYSGYGDQNLIRFLMNAEKPDAIFHFTDPRYWIWLYEMEHELREFVPLFFYHIWDDLPFPKYNQHYYRSCDFIACISKQTYNIVKNVWVKEPKWKDWQVKYIPHGINENLFKKLPESEYADVKKKFFGEEEVDFVVFYNNRNIRRKMTNDVMLAFRKFFHALPPEQAKKTRLLMHTHPIDENGTDLPRVIADVMPEMKKYIVFSVEKTSPMELNKIYNLTDVTINLASNEGFGLATLEAMAAEKMIIANVTGGLQDQMGFLDEKGNLVDVDTHYNKEWGSNHDGRYKTHGEWVEPVFPNNLSLIGSVPTPYIFDDRCDWREAADAILKVYNYGKEERDRRGKLGREYALTHGMTSAEMGKSFIEHMDEAFKQWKPRERFGIFKA